MNKRTLAGLRPSSEEGGCRFGKRLAIAAALKADSGFLLGGEKLGIADVVTATLWSMIPERSGEIEVILEKSAPTTAALGWHRNFLETRFEGLERIDQNCKLYTPM